jgi:hypothetical protein
MNDELDAIGCGNTNLQDECCVVWADQHDEVIELEYSDWVAVGVEHVVVVDPMFTALCRITGSTTSSSGHFNHSSRGSGLGVRFGYAPLSVHSF